MGWIGAGDNPEKYRIGVLTIGHVAISCTAVSWNVAEEEVGDVALKNDDLAVARKDPREHADGALQDGYHRQHGRYAEGDTRDADKTTECDGAEGWSGSA
jgi:hypothetical protein